MPNFRPAAVTQITRRVTRTEGGRSIRLYRAVVDGAALAKQTQKGIASGSGTGTNTNHNLAPAATSDASFKMWIPLSVVQQALPLFVRGQDLVQPPPVSMLSFI